MDGPPPPPPPHGANPKTTGGSHASGSGLPAGNYDIFIIPPHSSGSGFLYLPSLQVQRNSFIAGVASTLASIAVWKIVEPTVKQWFLVVSQSVNAGGNGVILLVAIVGIAGWAFGKMQFDGSPFGGGGSGKGNGPQGGAGAGAGPSGAGYQQSPPNGSFPGAGGGPPPQGAQGGWHGGQQHHHHQHGAPPPPPPHENDSWSGSQPDPNARAEYEKAQEEARKQEEEKKKRQQEEERKKQEEEKKRQEEERKRQEEEKKRQEEEKKRQEEERRTKEEADRKARAKAEKEKWERMRAREREQREREARERLARERAQKEKDAKEKEQREREAREAEARAKIEKEIREKLEAEQRAKAAEEAAKKAAEEKAKAEAEAAKAKAEAEATAAKAKADAERAERLKAARERAQRDREARLKAEAEKLKAQTAASTAAASDPITQRRSTTYGGIGGGERLDPYAGARSPPAPSVTSTHSNPIKATVSPKKNYEKPSAKSYIGTEDAHSFRPYDTPKRPGKAPSASAFSESSYAPSQSTARTTPPPSQRGPYSTNDPDKIVIRAVYLFNDLFPKPVAQLVSGVGKVTDGLILKIQSEGLFIDDDVRNIPQREWDVKAWTLKMVETGQQTSKHLHILRACVRDADGKKYVFILDESESWKLAIGLQRLRKGSQVRSLQNSQMAPNEVLRILNTVPPLPVQ